MGGIVFVGERDCLLASPRQLCFAQEQARIRGLFQYKDRGTEVRRYRGSSGERLADRIVQSGAEAKSTKQRQGLLGIMSRL